MSVDAINNIGCLDGIVTNCTNRVCTTTYYTLSRACDGLIWGTVHNMVIMTDTYGYMGALQMYAIEPTLLLLKGEITSAAFHTTMKGIEVVTCLGL